MKKHHVESACHQAIKGGGKHEQRGEEIWDLISPTMWGKVKGGSHWPKERLIRRGGVCWG